MPQVGDIIRADQIGYTGDQLFVWRVCGRCGKGEYVEKRKNLSPICKICSGRKRGKYRGRNRPPDLTSKSQRENLAKVIRYKTKPEYCTHCGGTFIIENYDGDWECLCGEVFYREN